MVKENNLIITKADKANTLGMGKMEHISETEEFVQGLYTTVKHSKWKSIKQKLRN